MDAAAEIGSNPRVGTRFSLRMENEQADAGQGRPNPSRKAKLSGANGDRELFIFPVNLTTSRIGNLTRLIHTLLCVRAIHTYVLSTRANILLRRCSHMALTKPLERDAQ